MCLVGQPAQQNMSDVYEKIYSGTDSNRLSNFNLYDLEYSDYFLYLQCYIHNVSADTSFGLLQTFYVEPRSEFALSTVTVEYIDCISAER